jgi:ABC-type branched-subunit amino acid transport system substrate-binding protein
VDKFTKRYNYKPNPTAALAYDAMNLIKTGLERWNWVCDLNANRDGLRNVMEILTEFDGVSGVIPSFAKDRNPSGKCIQVGKVSSQYQPIFHDEYCIDEL